MRTDFRTRYTFTYTFFDAKTLEVIGRWPQAPYYQIQGAPAPLGAAFQTIV